MRKAVVLTVALALLAFNGLEVMGASSGGRKLGVNVLLNQPVSNAVLKELEDYGKVGDVLESIQALTMKVSESSLPELRQLPFVAAVNPDAERLGAPIDTVPVEDFMLGLSSWNLDAVNVADVDSGARIVQQTGEGVYVAVLDTGLLDSWRQYFPQERVATEYAICFGGGGGERGFVSTQPNKWEHDQDSHGTHVTSTILGYSLGGMPITGAAPLAKVIPVKVLGQAGWGWSSVIARGIMYVAELKAGPLADNPVIINMSLGGPVLDAVEQAAIDYAISQGVIIVASAGNLGQAGMGYPGAYEPVISVAAAGWAEEWSDPEWWLTLDVANPADPDAFYITDFSSRELTGQDLDVAAPGSWIVGPYQVNSGQISYYFLGGTSMASPHVAGIVALMAEKDPELTAAGAELILEATAIPIPAPSTMTVLGPWGPATYSWDTDATGAGLVDAVEALGMTTP